VKVTEAKSWLLAEAAKRGVDLEVLATNQSKLTIQAQNGAMSDVNMASSGGIGLRVVTGGRVGYAYSEELTEDALNWTLDEAIGNAELQEQGQATLPAGGALGRHELVDEGLSASLQEKKDTAIKVERQLAQDKRVQAVQYAGYAERRSEVEIGSTKGVDGAYRVGYASLFSALVMREGDSVKQGYEGEAKREFHQLDPGRTAQDALRKIGRHLGAKPLTTGRRRAIFEPDVVATLLMLFTYAASGKTLAEGRSRLADKLGQKIASDLVTIVDDPTLPDGLGSRPFDAEGSPAQRLVILEEGVLRSFIHNSDTAARTQQANTGHAARSYKGTLDVATSNLLLLPGSGVTRKDGLLVTDLMGVHAGANPITGDVSVQAMGLELIGGEEHPVDDFAISFNLFNLLERVEEVGNDAEWIEGWSGVSKVPSLAVADVSFAGA